MEIKEVEKLLSVSRSNIRYYEKEGLINPERKENNYRDYSESDVATLKKILILRKLGFTVDEISSMQKGEISLSQVATENILRLEKEINDLKGALNMTKNLSEENPSFETLDQERLWNDISTAEEKGQKFADICKDCLEYESEIFDNVWKNVFFHNFKKSRKNYGLPIAIAILVVICIVRGISSATLWNGSFLQGALYPIIIFAVASIILVPIFIISKKSPKAGAIISKILMTICLAIIAFFLLALVFLFIKSLFVK